ncbi:hypothetical protein ACJZ2D_002218 [Fusarium nematophilum]
MEDDYDLTGFLSQRVDQEQVQREMENMTKNPMGVEPQRNSQQQQPSAVQVKSRHPDSPAFTWDENQTNNHFQKKANNVPAANGQQNHAQRRTIPSSASPSSSVAQSQPQPMHMATAPSASMPRARTGIPQNGYLYNPFADAPVAATATGAAAGAQLQQAQQQAHDAAFMKHYRSMHFRLWQQQNLLANNAAARAQQQAIDPNSQRSLNQKQQAEARRKDKQVKRAQRQPQVPQNQQLAAQPQPQKQLPTVVQHAQALRPSQYHGIPYNQQRYARPQQQTLRTQQGVQGLAIAQPVGPRAQPKTSPRPRSVGGRDNPIAIGDNDDDAHGATGESLSLPPSAVRLTDPLLEPQLSLQAPNPVGQTQRVPKPPSDVVRSKKRISLDAPQPAQANERSASSESVSSQCSRQSSQMNNLVVVTQDGNIQTKCAVAIKDTISEAFGAYHLPAAAAQQQPVDNQQPALDPQLQSGTPIAQPAGNLPGKTTPQCLSDLFDETSRVAFIRGAESAFTKMMFQASFEFIKTGAFCGLELNLPDGMTREKALSQIRAKMDLPGFVENHASDGADFIRSKVLPHYTHLLPTDFNTSGADKTAPLPNPSILAQLSAQARVGSQAQSDIQAQLDIAAQSNAETKPKRSRAKKVEKWTLQGESRDTTFNGFTITSYHCSNGTWRALEGNDLTKAKRRTAQAEKKQQQNGGQAKPKTPAKRKAKSQPANSNGQTKKARTTEKTTPTLQPSLASNSDPVGLQNAQPQSHFQPQMPQHLPTYPQVELIQPASQAAQAGTATTAAQPEMNYATPVETIQPTSHDQVPQRPAQPAQAEMAQTTTQPQITQPHMTQAAPAELPQASEIPQDFSFLPQVEVNQNNEAPQVDVTQPVLVGADPMYSRILGPQDEQTAPTFDQEFGSFYQYEDLNDFINLPDAHQVDENQPAVAGADPITAVNAPEPSSSIDTDISDQELIQRVLALQDFDVVDTTTGGDVDTLNNVHDADTAVAANESTQAPAMVQGRNGNWGVLALPGLPGSDNAPILDNSSSDNSPSNNDSHANDGNTTSPSSVGNNGDQAKDDSALEDPELWGSGNDDLFNSGGFECNDGGEWNDANLENFATTYLADANNNSAPYLMDASNNAGQANDDNFAATYLNDANNNAGQANDANATPTWDNGLFNDIFTPWM